MITSLEDYLILVHGKGVIRMDDSILNSVKIQLGIPKDHTEFDEQLIRHINSVFISLYQIGAGPEEGFSIESRYDEWNDFSKNRMLVNAVREYMYLKVKILFDPSTSSAVGDSIKDQLKELEFRINVASDL